MKKPDVEELLAIVAAPADPNEKELGEVERWVIAAGIKEGSARVDNILLYHTYCEWAERPINKYQFSVQFSKLFTQHRHPKERFYLLDPAPFDLSRDTYFKLRRAARDARKRNARQKDKKIPD